MMHYKGYIGKVEYDDDAKILHGEVIGIRDVITFQADSATEIKRAFCDSVDDYLDFCKSRGEEPEKPASGKFLVRVPAKLHRELSMLAANEDKSLNSLVEEVLTAEATRKLRKSRA